MQPITQASLTALAMAIALTIAPQAFAEDSEKETPVEEQDLALKYQNLPESAKTFVAYLQELDARYPDSARVDMDALMQAEGENIALRYCAANDIDGACAPDEKSGELVSLSDGVAMRGAEAKGRWWEWLWNHSFNIGVIPEANTCPAQYAWTQIHMDDEDRRNANNRSGWIGAISSTANTTYRFCRLDPITSLLFRPLPRGGDEHDYAVVNMGILCPSGARRLVRVEENELWRNANSSSGDIFPNFRIYNTSFNFYCVFDGAASSLLGHMSEFPVLGMPYGVFASRDLPAPYALARGRVYQDDEDFLNWNGWWFGSGDRVMWGDRNTERATAKVR